MAKLTDYYLKPGTEISANGLPGGKLGPVDKCEYIREDHAEKIGPSLDYLVAVGKVGKGVIPADPEDENGNENEGSGKSAKRIALENQAAELGIEFTDKTLNKDLSALIDAKLAE